MVMFFFFINMSFFVVFLYECLTRRVNDVSGRLFITSFLTDFIEGHDGL